MLTAQKIKQVKKELRRGVPQGEIKNQLMKEGYSTEEVNKIFKPHQYDMRGCYFFSATVFFSAGVWFFSLLLIAGSAVMFSMYYMEKQKIKKEKSL